MAFVPYWYPNPHQFDNVDYLDLSNPWDFVILQGILIPGLAKVRVSKGRKLDIKQPPGSHGATITDRGYKPAAVEISLTIFTARQWSDLQALFNGLPNGFTLEPKPNNAYKAPAYPIDHPATAMRQVASIIIEDIEGPEPSSSIHGAVEFKFKCTQFFPPPKVNATNTPEGTIAPQPNALAPTDPATTVPAP
ncbi:MAG TPA: hypothetical protein VGI10_22725 [Polyangiaceae bacterium]|jgi:hypothetical protein